MNERIMVVTGAFATHTTKLYNYYVCPANWKTEQVEFIAVNYFDELKYIGKVIKGPFPWSFDASETFSGININDINSEIQNDLKKFKTLLNIGNHQLFLLQPLVNACVNFLKYKGKGAFVWSHRYFNSLDEMLIAHQNTKNEGDQTRHADNGTTSINDDETNVE
jgi:hypothetical protein